MKPLFFYVNLAKVRTFWLWNSSSKLWCFWTLWSVSIVDVIVYENLCYSYPLKNLFGNLCALVVSCQRFSLRWCSYYLCSSVCIWVLSEIDVTWFCFGGICSSNTMMSNCLPLGSVCMFLISLSYTLFCVLRL